MSYDDGEFSNYESALSLLRASGSLSNQPDPRMCYLAVMQAMASSVLAVADELRRQNDRGDAFTVELLSFFERLTEDPQPGPDGSLCSEQPAAAPDGQEGGKA